MPVIDAHPRRAPLRWRTRGLAALGSLLYSIALSFIYGVNAWAIGPVHAWVADLGRLQCGTEFPRLYLQEGRCPIIGFPEGTATVNGGIFSRAATFFALIFPGDDAAALSAWYLIWIVLALVGAYGLFFWLTSHRLIAGIAAAVWMINPSVIGMGNFGTTFWGALLLPATIYVGVVLLRFWLRPPWWRRLLAVAGWCGVLTWAVFLDGYSFVMLGFTAGVVVIVLPLLRGRSGLPDAGLGFVYMAVASAVALVVYYRSAGGALAGMGTSEDFFRSMGVDVATTIIPTSSVWWADLLGIGLDADLLWGDGTNVRWNYIGMTALVLLVCVLVWARGSRRYVLLWTFVALVAFVIALGPSLKWWEIRGPLTPPIQVTDYLMPRSEALWTFPWAPLYEELPGLDLMRAIYRWMLVVRLALLAALASGISALVRREVRASWRRVVCGILAALAVLASAPNLAGLVVGSSDRATHLEALIGEIPEKLDAALPDDAVVAFSSPVSGGNDFLAGVIASESDLVLYNTFGDKDVARARENWTPEMQDVIGPHANFGHSVWQVLYTGQVQAVVIPNFDFRWGIEQGPTDTYAAEARVLREQIASDPRLRIEPHADFTIVRLAE